MKDLIRTLEAIKEHQMNTVELARTTEVYKLADQALKQVKLFAIPDVIEPKGKLKCECKDEWMEDVIYVQCSKCGEKY